MQRTGTGKKMSSEPLSGTKSLSLEEHPAQGNYIFVETVNPQSSKCRVAKRNLVYGFIAALVLGTIVLIPVLFQKHPGPSCDFSSPCPPLWIMYEKKCYYFSKEEKNWTSSQAFCLKYNASLARIAAEEKDFVMWLKGNNYYWIDLRRDQEQSWKWTNGKNATLDVIGKGGDCAYLTEGFKASSSRCNNKHYWICQKSVGATDPVIEWKEDGGQLDSGGNSVDSIRAH